MCCAPAYLEKHSAPRSPADLAGHNCLLYTYSMLGREWPFVDPAGNPTTMRVSGNLATTSNEAIRAAAVAGVGLWMATPYIAYDLLVSGAVVPILRDYKLPEVEIVALYPHRRHMTAKVRAFIDVLVDRFAAGQGRLVKSL